MMYLICDTIINNYLLTYLLTYLYEPNKSNPLFGFGHGWSKKFHCRIRLGLSHLRKQLFSNQLIEQIECNNIPETPKHFFLECP